MQPGGQLTTTTDIENYPGFENGVSGQGLVSVMRAQAARLGADIRTGAITSADLSQRPFKLVVDGEKEIVAETLIIATGATAKYLGLPSETKFKGLGVSACATCDGFFYRKKTVAVVGGGDTACEEATYLAGLCKKVYMIVRRDVLRASEAMQERVRNTENIEILWNCNTQEVLGDEYGVTGVRLVRKDGEVFDVALDGFFLAIGHHPNSELFSQWVKVDNEGYDWIKAELGIIDYVVPQLYWEIGHKAADYETLVGWWAEHAAGRPLFVGQDVMRTVKATDLNDPTQHQQAHKMQLQRSYESIGGSCQWPASAVADNVKGYATALSEEYHRWLALQPEFPFMDKVAPGKVKKITA